ncbi:MAG: lamin tail domain-containing protein [Clostridia bacterium]|nr:lamin tail domain-containing protein [Clostridia bacterium]
MSGSDKVTRSGWQRLVLPLAIVGAVAILAGWLMDRNGWGALQARATEGLEGVRVSEVQNNNVLTLPEGASGGPAWIELENTGDAPVSLHGLCLTRDAKLTRTLVFPDIRMEPGTFLLVYADGKGTATSDGALHAPFRLPRSGAHTLYLYDSAQRLLDEVEVPAMQADEAFCRDGDGEWTVTAEPTPGRANDLSGQRSEEARDDDAALNELMCVNTTVFPDATGECHDYVEIANRSGREIDLEGYWLSDHAAKPDKWRFPAVILPAGGVLAIHCSGEDRRDDPAHLHTNFKLSKGETVCLFRPDGKKLSSVTLPQLQMGQALSWTDDGGWGTDLPPTPNRENTLEAVLALDTQRRGQRAGGVFISEVMANPISEKRDWLELCNDGSADADLSGWGLSDKLSHPRKWQFPAGTVIPAHGRLAVFLVGDGSAPAGGYLSAPFALPADGGCAVSLCDASGGIRDWIYLPQQYPGVSFGRDDSGSCGYFSAPTPLAANGAQALLGPAPGARYSTMGGLHVSGEHIEVTLTANPGARVYYTLDCSDPDEGDALYDGTPIPVDGTTILRTRVYEDGHLPSIMDTQSYLFDVNNAGEVPYVISLVSDPTGLYSDETGIMVMGPNAEARFPHGDYGRGANFWMDWEREAHVELFTGAGETAISQECGIKLHGRNTRAFELKSFKVMAKGRYGAKTFAYPIFHERPWDEYEAFILRYAGQDYKYTFMRDVVLTRQAANTGVMYMEAEEGVVYLNGEYYSAMYVRENISAFSLARREGWDGQEAALDLVKSGQEVKQGSNASYAALRAWLDTHDNNTQEAYERIAAEVDIDNFIEFATFTCVYSPPDTVNVKRYRNLNADGRWRWVLYDLDRGLRDGNNSVNGFELMAQGTNAQLFNAVMANDALREKFLDNLNLALSTYLSSASMARAVQAQYARIKPLLPDYLEKVGVTQSRFGTNMKNLMSNVRSRPARVLRQCAEYLGMGEDEVRARFPEAVAAIEAYREALKEDAGPTIEKEETP